MHEHSLLATKLNIPPIRPKLVSRPRLLERLNAGLPSWAGSPRARDAFCRALTLISAPAGFGKTTLVSEWVQAMGGATPPIAIAWLSLDEGESDPARFLAYMIAALRTLDLSTGGTSRVEGRVLSGGGGTEGRQEPASLQEPVGLIGDGALSALQSPQPPPAEDILTELINEIAGIPDRIVLVLDDYHLIDSSPVDNALTFLLERLPPQMHLVIATRDDPQLPLARLRARGQLTELRASDLRFSYSEAAEFLKRVMGLDLSAEDIAALERRTEGWIAGLQLAAISMQGHQDTSGLVQSFTGSHRYVLDYLIEEVLEQQPERVQAFLLQTSVLDRLTGSLCDAVRFGHAEAPGTSSGTTVRFGPAESVVRSARAATTRADAVRSARGEPPNGQATLEMLERSNLFIIPLDAERRWYRYHHLFADLLRQRLRHTQPDWVPRLHLRASQWYEQNGFADEAIGHALLAEGFERAARLLEEHADAMWTHGEHAKLRRWLARLPGEVLLRKPLLCVLHAWFLYAKGPRDAAGQYLQAVEQVLDSCTDRATEFAPLEQDHLSDSDRQKLRGRVAVIRAFMATYLGDVPAIIEHAHQALEYLPKQDLTWRSSAAIALGDALGFKGDMGAAYQARLEAAEASAAAGSTVFSILAYIKVAITLREQGHLQRTIEICQQQIQLAGKSGLSRGSVAGCLLAIWGEVLAELGDLEGALAQARRGVEQAERGGDWSLFGWSCLCLIRVLFSAGHTAGAQEIVHEVENTARESVLPPWITNQMAAWQVRIWVAQDRLGPASQWLEARGLHSAGEPEPLPQMDYFVLIEYVLLARIMIAQARLDGATRLLPWLLEAAEAGGRKTRVIEILNLQALTYQAGGNMTQAMSAIERALVLAEPEGFIRTFVDEGLPMARLLYEAVSRGISPDYAHLLLAAFPAGELDQLGRRKAQAPEPDLVEPLSERELEVLQLIAEGLTNREIASRLFVALNTVKAHIRNIYGKLGVNSRTQAVARARALEIFPSI